MFYAIHGVSLLGEVRLTVSLMSSRGRAEDHLPSLIKFPSPLGLPDRLLGR